MLYKDRCVSSGSADAWRALSTALAGRADDRKRARRGPRRAFPGRFQQGAGQARLGTSFLTAPGFTLQNHWKGLKRTIFIYELKFIDFPNRIIPSRRNSFKKQQHVLRSSGSGGTCLLTFLWTSSHGCDIQSAGGVRPVRNGRGGGFLLMRPLEGAD